MDKDDGPDNLSDYVLLKRGKRHDYFTSCLPWPQKGDVVELPLGTAAPIATAGTTASNPAMNVIDGSGAQSTLVSSGTYVSVGSGITGASSDLYADLSQATAATINQLREAFQIQRLYERDARGGTRYIEIVRSHFGVVSPDARLQRPEYLGGGVDRDWETLHATG